MKKTFSVLILVLLLSGCTSTSAISEYDVSFPKIDENNNVFEKSEVNCSFYTTQIISGKPNYPGDNPAYDRDPLKEGFQITNYPSPSGDTFDLKIVGLDSETPKIVGNAGEEQLISLNGNQFKISTKVFLEKGPSENDSISAYNISENGSVIWIKTYDNVEPFSMIHVGYCE
ncbi:lipoprotein [Candidatus Peregrinibacteria bacterium]|jgi:hypothetical protein|nr:lipoprotein [Candidatus Peregrinibacteria bacterium]